MSQPKDDANSQSEKERDRFLKKQQEMKGPVPNVPVTRQLHFCYLGPEDISAVQTCEVLVNGLVCTKVPNHFVWYTDPLTGKIVAKLLCVSHYARRLPQLWKEGWQEVRHDDLPQWYKEWLKQKSKGIQP